jgi:spore coat polysaccharide biosynthesis protein SpsF
MNEGVFIPIRLESERLPKKIIKLVGDKPILYYMLDRIIKSKFIKSKKNIVICTTKEQSDNPLEKIVNNYGASIFRGAKDDLIDRFYNANKIFNFKNILLIDGDDPLIFPEHLDLVLSEQKKSKFDCVYTSNLPFGLNIKSVTYNAINKVYKNYLSKKNDTGFGLYFTNTYMIKSKKIFKFKINNLLLKARLTLDYSEDFDLIKKIINELYIGINSNYSFKVFQKYIVENPNILKINLFRQNEHLERSNSKINLNYKNNNKVLNVIY